MSTYFPENLRMIKNTALIYSKFNVIQSDNYIPTVCRNTMVHSLIDACGLLSKIDLIEPEQASMDKLLWFHSKDYLYFLEDHSKKLDDDEDDQENNAFYGFGYDCPLKPDLLSYCMNIAGGSITGAKFLCEKKKSLVLHWLGGWHHAKRSEAAGYCYVNDCVLAILQLRTTFTKILYVDLDLHHGDGVQDAFYGTDKVMTFSIHKFEPGFFPGTGGVTEVGFGKGRNFSLNLPLLDGITDDLFINTCKKVLCKIFEKFRPNAVVCQAGADGLNGDPMRSFNLTTFALDECIKFIVNWNLPTLILGGGGYNEANVARCWTQITASCLDEKLPEDIPEHHFFARYGPDFNFKIDKSYKKDCNSEEYLSKVANILLHNLDQL